MSLFKKISKVFEPKLHKIRTVSQDSIITKPGSSKFYEFGVLYKIKEQVVFDGNPESKTYIIAFETQEHIDNYGEYYDEDCSFDSLNTRLTFGIDLDYLPLYEHHYYTHVKIYENSLVLYVEKEDYDFYISKKILARVAYGNKI